MEHGNEVTPTANTPHRRLVLVTLEHIPEEMPPYTEFIQDATAFEPDDAT